MGKLVSNKNISLNFDESADLNQIERRLVSCIKTFTHGKKDKNEKLYAIISLNFVHGLCDTFPKIYYFDHNIYKIIF